MAKRFRPDSGSDTSTLDESLSYLDLDTGNILEKTTSPNSSSKGVILPAKTYDALMKKLNHIDTSLSKLDKLDKLDNIEKAVRKINDRVDNVEKRLEKNESVVSAVEKSSQFMSNKYDDMKKESDAEKETVKKIVETVSEVQTETDDIRSTLTEALKVNSELKEELLDLKSRSMRDNLIFRNIEEKKDENTEEVLKKFLSDHLKMNNISFERVHRMREKQTGANRHSAKKPKLIVAKFNFFKERERVRKSAKMLKGTNFSIQEQFPEEIEKRRKPLYPLLKAARQADKRASLVKDRLYVEGKEVLPPVEATAKSAAATPMDTSAASGVTITHF